MTFVMTVSNQISWMKKLINKIKWEQKKENTLKTNEIIEMQTTTPEKSS